MLPTGSWRRSSYVHRTFNGRDLRDFVLALRRMEELHGGIGSFFETRYEATRSIPAVFAEFRREFFSCGHAPRCEKHLSSIEKGAACNGSACFCAGWCAATSVAWTSACGRGFRCRPFTFRSTSIQATWPARWGCSHAARTTGGAVEQVTAALRGFDPADPVRYDFSLFGAGIDGYLRVLTMFRFKRFTIRQDRCPMKVGTDGVLLGAWAACGLRTAASSI